MRLPACLSLVLLAAASACTSATDGPTTPLISLGTQTPIGVTYVDDGEPPPPPIDTGGTVQFNGASFQFNGVYFENKQNANTWIVFQNSAGVVASPNARLMYNPRTLRTKGVGTLTVGATVIELQFVSISRLTPGGFAACPTTSTSDGPCSVLFDYPGTTRTNSITLHERDRVVVTRT